jgi:hypothetical protein
VPLAHEVLLAHGDVPHGGLSTGVFLAAVGLGAFHGLNPGMGWLFALSYGLQQKNRRAIGRAIVPIAIGHELSVLPIAVAIGVFAVQVTRAVAVTVLAVVLIGFGIYLLLRKRHFRWVGMRLTPLQLGWWSFLMSTASGAGLMLAPLLVGNADDGHAMVGQALDAGIGSAVFLAISHGVAMMVVAWAVALLVYQTFGLRILRTAWINLDRIWAIAFILAGVLIWFV